MINFNDVRGESTITQNLEWPYIPDHPYRTLIIGGSKISIFNQRT